MRDLPSARAERQNETGWTRCSFGATAAAATATAPRYTAAGGGSPSFHPASRRDNNRVLSASRAKKLMVQLLG